jgi:hypothetical protein
LTQFDWLKKVLPVDLVQLAESAAHRLSFEWLKVLPVDPVRLADGGVTQFNWLKVLPVDSVLIG